MLVSIIIPVYGVSAYIEQCVKSVMNQTFKDIECIIIDDATQDDSIIKCERLIERYNGHIQFLILHHKQNKGLSAARNTGIDAATGDYVFFLDGDDEITHDCIEKMVRPVKKDTTIEMVKGCRIRVSGNKPLLLATAKRKCQEENIVSLKAVRDFHFNRTYSTAAWNKLIKKDFLLQHQLYFKEGIVFEDTLWSFFVVKYLCHLYIIPDITYYYYRRSQSITTGTNRMEVACNWLVVYSEIANNFTSCDSGREAKRYVKGFCRRCINCSQPAFLHTAHLFDKALSDNQYKGERRFLAVTSFMSKTAVGRTIFIYSERLRKVIRKLLKSSF